MDKNEVRVTLRLPADLHARILQVAAENDRSLNGQIVHWLRKAVQEASKPNRTLGSEL